MVIHNTIILDPKKSVLGLEVCYADADFDGNWHLDIDTESQDQVILISYIQLSIGGMT